MKALPSWTEALARMREAVTRLDPEPVDLAHALGRVLAEPITATRDQPPFDASAMDGWAVRREDVGAETSLTIIGQSAAGARLDAGVGPGQAARIFTGAPMPEGADWVVLQERAEQQGDRVRLGPVSGGSNVRPRGGDFREGDILVHPGRRLDPWLIALAAAAGRNRVSATRAPVVAVLATGDELAAPGQALRPDQIHDSAGPALAALIALWGGDPVRLPNAADSADAIVESLGARPFDLLVTIGGASVGDHDLVKPALRTLGLSLSVEGVAIKPGKPVWFGRLTDRNALVLGLPGNPASALVCAELFLRPILADLLGQSSDERIGRAALHVPLPANGPREQFLRGRSWIDAEGWRRVQPFQDQDSSLVSVFARADVLIRRAAGADAAEAGDVVEVLNLDRLQTA